MKFLLCCILLVTPTVMLGADDSPARVKSAEPTKPSVIGEKSGTYAVELKIRDVPQGYTVFWDLVNEPAGMYVRTVKVEKAVIFAGPVGNYTARVRWFKEDDSDELRIPFTITGGTPTPPGPGPTPDPGPGPGPTPPSPTPPPVVSSFRVILVYESQSTLTPAQNSILYGALIENYLTSRTTKDGTRNGWRRHDKDDATTGDTQVMNDLWAAVKPKVTAVPCVAVEVNGKVEVIPFAASDVEMLKTIKAYVGDK